MMKASTTMSSKVVLTELRILVHRLMYDLNVSSAFWTQAHNSSHVFGRSASDAKFLMKSLLNSSHESYDDGAYALSQSRAVPSSISCMYCMVVVLVPRWHETASM